MVFTFTLTDQNTRVNGLTTSSTAREEKPGKTAANTTAITLIQRKKERECTPGPMATDTLATGKTTPLTDLVSTSGQTEEPTADNGSTT
jgi:hypothetical protein